jgi:hypothetical protein
MIATCLTIRVVVGLVVVGLLFIAGILWWNTEPSK